MNINVAVRKDQYDFLVKESKRIGVSIEETLLIFLLDGRLTPFRPQLSKPKSKEFLEHHVRPDVHPCNLPARTALVTTRA